ncbi:arylamine N-acetyltransferase [Streptomyces sp. NPDC090499]|uniref:arylamine N-acetyltransferase n=1 Tax=unclassified Streptomyces TaxID=2593676 RepID=UPI0037FCD719
MTPRLTRTPGVCFELGRLFSRLPQDLGFEVQFLSAGVCGPDGKFGPDLQHLFHCVHHQGDVWLVDVGFSGPSFLEPLRVSADVQEQFTLLALVYSGTIEVRVLVDRDEHAAVIRNILRQDH